MPVSAKVVADSRFRDTRLITLEVEFHRFILPEFNTHRAISRNFQSSRAVPIEKMIEQVRNDPAIPVHFGKNQPGMQAEEEGDVFTGVQLWDNSAACAAEFADKMNKNGFHKQIVNRLLEPFMWTKGVVTATERDWTAFFKLRLHKDAQPEIYVLAEKIKEAIEESTPIRLKTGEWHAPYYYFGVWTKDSIYIKHSLESAIKISASCCAQVSYRKLDDSLDKAEKIYDMLNLPVNGVYPEDPPHFSPTEHVARASEQKTEEMSGNFHTKDFVQYRKILEAGLENAFIR